MTDRIEWQEPQPDRMCRLVVTYDHTERDATPLDLERAGYVPTPQHSRVSDLERALADLAARTGERDTERRKTEAWKRTVDAAVNAAREWAVVGDGHNFRAMMADLLAATAFADDTRPASLPREGQERTCDDYDTEYVLDAMAAAAVNQPPAKGCETCGLCGWYSPTGCRQPIMWSTPACSRYQYQSDRLEPPANPAAEPVVLCTPVPEAVQRVVEEARKLLPFFRDYDGIGGIRGHSHTVPRVWDPDNGALAGKTCEQCVCVEAFVAAVRALDKGGAP